MHGANISAMRARIQTELLDLVELVLLPGTVAILPWTWCFAFFKRAARWRWLYRSASEEALNQARLRGWSGANEAHWLWVRKMITLVDHADHYLGLWRSDVWMRRYVHVEGVWPQSGKAVLLVTLHWGAGYWGLRHAAANGLHPHALVASLESDVYQTRTVLAWYARSRNANVARTLGATTIDIAQQLKQVIRALRDGDALLGVIDVPADGAKASLDIELLGMQASVPRALLRLAVDQKIPVVLYTTGLNTSNGQRLLKITPLGVHTNVEELASLVFSELERLIAMDAPAWHFWGIAERFFRTTERL